MSDLFYKEIIQAKNGQAVPVFNSGRAAHSKYDPAREAQNFLAGEDAPMIAAIAGVAGGWHIQALANKNPKSKIIAIEKSAADLEYLRKNIPCVEKLCKNERIIFCAADAPGQIEGALLDNYLPALDGDLKIAALRPWADEAGSCYDKIIERIKAALKKIGADYSVQARFGLLWQKNIFCNLKTLQKIQSSGGRGPIAVDTTKTAAIVAAGPTLDKTVETIKAAREKYFVIATDTGYKILSRRNIKVDAVVSIDAQWLSAEHFDAPLCKDTIFVLDLAANPSIARFAFERGAKIIFTSSGHPLISYAGNFCKEPFARLSSGGGTVTIAAADFAKSCGFEKMRIFGADFGYSDAKPYARGSYLDDLYRSDESRVQNSETAFVRLMFRTPLKKNAAGFLQNDILLGYQNTMEEFLRDGTFKRENFLYDCQFEPGPDSAKRRKAVLASNEFDFASFKRKLASAAAELENSDGLSPQTALILPCMAFYKTKLGQNKNSTKEAKKLALNRILLYNNLL